MQPFYEVTICRPWHWGIAIVGAPGAMVPTELGPGVVTATQDCLVIKVRHAQDIDIVEGESDLATATLRLRSLGALTDDTDDVLYQGELALSDGKVTIGDADGEVSITEVASHARVRVYAGADPEYGVTDVRVDFGPA